MPASVPSGVLNPAGMTSFNHYALGAVADWMHRVVGGLAATAPGYRRLTFRPRPGGGITSASVRHETPYGLAGISWILAEDVLTATLTVPNGVLATVDLPGREPFDLGPGTHTVTNR